MKCTYTTKFVFYPYHNANTYVTFYPYTQENHLRRMLFYREVFTGGHNTIQFIASLEKAQQATYRDTNICIGIPIPVFLETVEHNTKLVPNINSARFFLRPMCISRVEPVFASGHRREDLESVGLFQFY